MPAKKPTPPEATDTPRTRFPLIAAVVILLALALRIPLLQQSLWYDEISTIINYVRQPWEQIVAGKYSPNNHVLFTLLAKMCDEITGRELLPFATRFLSAVAGSLVGLALAWPLRRSHPLHAAALILLASLHPWLFSFSGWARGYALLLLLAVLSTTLLPSFSIANPKSKIANPSAYGVSLIALLYTHPLGIAVCAGHAVWMLPRFRTDRVSVNRWLITCATAAVCTIVIYSPFIPRLGEDYWNEAEKPSITYPNFLRQSFIHAHLGDSSTSPAHLILSLFICTIGTYFAWRWTVLRPAIVTFAVACIFGLLAPLILPLAGEVRAMIWLIPLYCLGVFGLLSAAFAATSRPLRYTAFAATIALALFLTLGLLHILRTPGQPIREAVALARQTAGADREVIGIYMASLEARQAYGEIDRLAYKLRPESPPEEYPSLLDAERHLLRPPVLVVFYEDFLKRDQRDLWDYIHQNYTPTHHLPGRISPATIYQKK